MMIRLGKKYGFRTLNLVRRPEQIAELKQLGGDAVLLTGSGSLSAEILRLTDGQGVRYALDAVGGAIGTEVIQALAPGGRAVLYGLLSGEPVSVDPRFLITGSKTVQGFWLADWAKQHRVLSMLRIIRQVRQLIRDGVLQTDAITPFAIEDYRSALIHAQTPGKAGKALLKFGGA
jgi:NADPH:quinone reductase-like Zn-dependent oxidoreductase